MSLAYQLDADGWAELETIRAERATDRPGTDITRDVDALCRAAHLLARGTDHLDHEALRLYLDWKLERFTSALIFARQLDRWPYRQARPERRDPPPATPKPAKWPEPVVAAQRPMDPPTQAKPDQPLPTPANPNYDDPPTETPSMATTSVTTKPVAKSPAKHAREEDPKKLSPLLLETLKTADQLAVGGRVDFKQLAEALRVSEKAIWRRIHQIRTIQGWPYESARKPGQHGPVKVVMPSASPLSPQPSPPPPPLTKSIDLEPAPTACSPASLDGLRTTLAAQAAVLDTIEKIPIDIRPAVLWWVVENRVGLMGGGQ